MAEETNGGVEYLIGFVGLLAEVLRVFAQHPPQAIADIINVMEQVDDVESVHHIAHVWEIAEHTIALKPVVIKKASLPDIERVKTDLKRVLHEQFKVSHSTLEMELDGSVCIDTRQADNHQQRSISLLCFTAVT